MLSFVMSSIVQLMCRRLVKSYQDPSARPASIANDSLEHCYIHWTSSRYTAHIGLIGRVVFNDLVGHFPVLCPQRLPIL